MIRHAGQLFGLELKSFANQRTYNKALTQAAKYGSEAKVFVEQKHLPLKQLGVSSIWLVLFIENIDETNRQRLEVSYTSSGVTVYPHKCKLAGDDRF